MTTLPTAALSLCSVAPVAGTPGAYYCNTHHGLTSGPVCRHIEEIVGRIVAEVGGAA